MPSYFAQLLHNFSAQPASQIKKREYKFFDVPPLGQGGYATVKLAHWKKHGMDVAVKIVPKAVVEDKEKYLRIINVGWGQVLEKRHPHIAPLLDWFESTNHYYLTFPHLSGGELLQRILDKRRFTEEEARRAMVNILETLAYIHHNGIIHRDIKAENFLYKTRESDIDDFQLIDFGISKILDGVSDEDPKVQREVSGTPGYAAPEIFLRTGYGKNSDVFSAGVVLYAMLSGSTPWDSKDPWELVKETSRMTEVNFERRRFDGVSEEAKDFVRYLMTPNPHRRPSAAKALESHWIRTPQPSCPPIPITRPTTPIGPTSPALDDDGLVLHNPDEPAHGPSTHPDPAHPIQVLRGQATLKPGTVEDEHSLERHLSRQQGPVGTALAPTPLQAPVGASGETTPATTPP